MLQVHNFALGTVSIGYDASATSIALTAGHGARFPSAGPYRCVWWNQTDYPNPANDPNREIVEVTARSTDTLTILRGRETSFGGLAASTKNTSAKVYAMALVETAESSRRGRADPDREVLFFDDFLYRPDQLSSTDWWIGMVANINSLFNWRKDDSVPTGLTSKRSGFAKLVSDAASQRVGFHQTYASFTYNGVFFSGGLMAFECELFPPNEAISDATNDYTIRIGIGVTGATYDNTDNGIWFEYSHDINSGNWRGVTRNAGTATNTDSSVAVAAGTLARLRWVRNAAATSVEFFINGTSVGVASTNVLADAVHCGVFMHMDRAAGTARRITWVDWVRLHQKFDAR